MQDLTTGPLTRHLLKTTGFMLVTMVFQTLYFLIDLYWVGRLGTEAVAAVGIAGNLSFIVLALTQMLGVGTTTVVSHAVGRKDHAQASSCSISRRCCRWSRASVFLVARPGVALAVLRRDGRGRGHGAAVGRSTCSGSSRRMALQFALVAMGSALRATGNFKPGMIVSTASVIINMVLAPFLIFGWGTGQPFGVAGAAISSLDRDRRSPSCGSRRTSSGRTRTCTSTSR